MRQLCLLYKFLSTGQPWHAHNLLPQTKKSYKHPNTFHVFSSRTEYLKNSFIHMLSMNGIKLIQAFEDLVNATYFEIHCESLWDLVKGKPSILMAHLKLKC